jgi:hypothetical protein
MKRLIFVIIGITLALIVVFIIIQFQQKAHDVGILDTENTYNQTSTDNSGYVPQSKISQSYSAGYCCCFVIRDDLATEELLPLTECDEKGTCIEVDPSRRTPHPCCPNATGPLCDSLLK